MVGLEVGHCFPGHEFDLPSSISKSMDYKMLLPTLSF